MNNAAATPRQTLAPVSQAPFFLMLRQTVDWDRLAERLVEVLHWIIQQKKERRMLLPGPVAPHEGIRGFRLADARPRNE